MQWDGICNANTSKRGAFSTNEEGLFMHEKCYSGELKLKLRLTMLILRNLEVLDQYVIELPYKLNLIHSHASWYASDEDVENLKSLDIYLQCRPSLIGFKSLSDSTKTNIC